MTDIKHLLKTMIDRQASDLHLLAGSPAFLRLDGVLQPVDGEAALTAETVRSLVFPLLSPSQKDIFLVNKELDFSFGFVVSTLAKMGVTNYPIFINEVFGRPVAVVVSPPNNKVVVLDNRIINAKIGHRF